MEIKVYSRDHCPYCDQLKSWLKEHNISFEEILVNTKEAVEQFKEDCPGQNTVPQILIDGKLIEGGHDGFMESEEKDLLEAL
jgi:glutaredoxin 3